VFRLVPTERPVELRPREERSGAGLALLRVEPYVPRLEGEEELRRPEEAGEERRREPEESPERL